MLFSELVNELAKKHPVSLLAASDSCDLQDISIIDGEQTDYCDSVVYFGYREQLPPDGPFPSRCVLGCAAGGAGLPPAKDIAVIEPSRLLAAFNAARALLSPDRMDSIYRELTSLADESRDLDAVINEASIKLGNSLILSDINFKIISRSASFPVVDPLWASNIEQGYCSYDFMTAVMQLDVIKNAALTTDAIEVSCSESPYRKLSSKIFLNGVQVGFVLMIASGTSITPTHFEILRTVRRALSYTISHYASYMFQGLDIYQHILYNLLIGAPLKAIGPRFPDLSDSKRYIALSFQPTRYLGLRHLKEHMGPALLSSMPDIHLTYHDKRIAALMPVGEEIDMDGEHLSLLCDFALREFVVIGISNAFSTVENFAKHYEQAYSALLIGQRMDPDRQIYLYQDYQFYGILSKLDATVEPGLFCHPALGMLRQYDQRNKTEFYGTLREYLACGCSIKDTAEKLFIHRNSMMYRLDRIKELGKIDLMDPEIRFLLRMSYKIDRYAGLGA
ncbi:MAG: CdaR family transcriptional regulator [Clostridia bacterium]|nr:CdaR family transcriptional regulator [Clostridia bacterium]